MAMIDGLIEGLAESPAVKNAMAQFKQVRDILVATVNRIDERFGQQDAKLLLIAHGMDKVLAILQKDPLVAPAADDGIQALVYESEVLPCPVEGCQVVGIHAHDSDGPFDRLKAGSFEVQKSEPVQAVHESELVI